MWQKNVRYLDYNASSGISPSVQQKLTEILSSGLLFANPTSRHRLGQKVRHALYESHLKIAKSLGDFVQVDDLIFTSSGTEANQTVLRSLAKDVDLLIIGAGEHSASYDLISELKSPEIVELPLLQNGEYDFAQLAQILNTAKNRNLSQVGLSLFWANNETGVITDLAELKSVLDHSFPSVRVHLDGAQTWGKIHLDYSRFQPEFTTFSAHKIGAPAGTGIIFKKSQALLHPLVSGTQSHGLRGGTENTLGILATAAASEALDSEAFKLKTQPLVERLEKGLLSLSVPVTIWGREACRVPNTSRFSFSHFKAYENWVELLDLRGFAVSHGSACKAQVIEPSRVLMKMGASAAEALNAIRVSFGPQNDENDVDLFLKALEEIIATKIKQTNSTPGKTP